MAKHLSLTESPRRALAHIMTAALLALAAAFAACSDGGYEPGEANQTLAEPQPMVFTAQGLQMTPATRSTLDGNWTDYGDATIKLKIGESTKDYSLTGISSDGTTATLTSTDPFYWTSFSETKTVTAWTHHTINNSANVYGSAMRVASDQSTIDNLRNSDYLVAGPTDMTFINKSTHKLSFAHQGALITVNITVAESSSLDITEAKAQLVNTNSSLTFGGSSTITAYMTNAGATHQAVISPQTIAAGKAFIKLSIDLADYFYTPASDIIISANEKHTFNLSISGTKLVPTGSSTIGGWGTETIEQRQPTN